MAVIAFNVAIGRRSVCPLPGTIPAMLLAQQSTSMRMLSCCVQQREACPQYVIADLYCFKGSLKHAEKRHAPL
jgi:hypothetical protein